MSHDASSTLIRHVLRASRRAGGAALLAAAMLTPAAAREIVDPARVQAAIHAPPVVERANRIDALDRTGAVDDLAAEVERTLTVELNPIAREWLLDRALHALARHAPTPAATRAVNRLSTRAPEVFARIDPEHGAGGVPLYDPGATARFTVQAWARARARESALAAFARGSSEPVALYSARSGTPRDDAARTGILEAMKSLPASDLARHRAAVVAALEGGAQVDELALAMAVRLGDAPMLELVLGHAAPDVALAAVREARATLSENEAFETLIFASRRSEIASAALLEMGALARDVSRAREHLFTVLDDAAAGPSAAAALGGLRDPGVALRLGERLRTSDSELTRRHTALALKLDGSAAARVELQRFARTPAGSPQLKSEVRAWLAQ